jgi:hypothetical protein
VNVAGTLKWNASKWLTITGGGSFKWNRTEYYKQIDDLLGGDYYVNIDSFAERDYASTPAMVQNDLDYYLNNGAAQVLKVGDKYGYCEDSGISPTEQEFNRAEELGLIKLVMVRGKDDSKREEKEVEFLRRVSDGRVRIRYHESDTERMTEELLDEVRNSLWLVVSGCRNIRL